MASSCLLRLLAETCQPAAPLGAAAGPSIAIKRSSSMISTPS
jgi:hypothetical protein